MKESAPVFHTNNFLEFQSHVTQDHSSHALSKSRDGFFTLAGLKSSKVINSKREYLKEGLSEAIAL